MRLQGIKTLIFASLLFQGCDKNGAIPVKEKPWYEVYPEHFPPPIIPEDNRPNASRIELGKSLFFDPVLSIDSSLSCASCHEPKHAFANLNPTTPGVFSRPGTRNVPGLFNMAYQTRFLREGGLPTLEMHVLVPIQEQNEFAFNIVDVAERLKQIPYYDSLSRLAYGRIPDAFTITRSIAAFQRTFISANSTYDQVITGKTPFSNQETKGRDLFFSSRLKCGTCHTAPFFTNHELINNGLYLFYDDPGLYRLTREKSDSGKFKVPSLRNVALTPPYMHNGSLPDLSAVVEHYASGGQNNPNKHPAITGFVITPEEKEALIQFLHTLSDSSFINNPHYRQ